jgi:hypothetical protein
MVPSPQNQTPDTFNDMDARGLLQIGLAVQQQKFAQSESEKQDSREALKMLSENPDLMATVDPKVVEKHLKNVGLNPASADQVGAMQKLINGQIPTPQSAAPPSTPVPVNNVEQIGKSMQPSGGAQAANPPSSSAGNKAPGGGVTPGGIVTPGTGQLQQLEQTGNQAFQKQVGALAPLYQGAAAQRQQQFMIAQKQNELHHLFEVANSGGPGAVAAQGALYAAAGKEFTETDANAIMTNSEDPAVRADAWTFFRHNESGAALAQRTDSSLKTLSGNTDFMGQLKDPTTVGLANEYVVRGLPVPSDLLRNGFTISQLASQTVYEKQLLDAGVPLQEAHAGAVNHSLGVPYSLSMTKALGGHTVQQLDALSRKTVADADLLRAQSEMVHWKAEADKINAVLKDPKYANVKDEFESLANIAKAGATIPPKVLQGAFDALSQLPNIDITPKDMPTFWNFLTGGTYHDYQPNQTSIDEALKGQATVGGEPERAPTLREAKRAQGEAKQKSYLDSLEADRARRSGDAPLTKFTPDQGENLKRVKNAGRTIKLDLEHPER